MARDIHSTAEFERALEGGGVAVFMFHFPWCPHCQHAMPTFKAMAREFNKKQSRVPIRLYCVNMDEPGNKESTSTLGIAAGPTFLLVNTANHAVPPHFVQGANLKQVVQTLEEMLVH